MKIVAMFAVLLWGGCAHASGMVQAITAIANTVYTGSLTVSPSTGATLVMPKGVCYYEIRTSLDNSSTGWVKVSTVSMAQASADLGEETGWQVFGSGVNLSGTGTFWLMVECWTQ